MERVRAGETALFELLIRRYNRRLYRVVWSILLNGGETEDAVQEAYVRAFQHLDQFDGRAQFATWLTKIAIYEAGARRKRGRRQVSLEALAPGLQEALTAAGMSAPESAEDEVFRHDLRRLLERALASLPLSHRQVFVLRHVEGLSTAAAAAALGLSRTATKVRLFRARRALRRELERLVGATARDLLLFAGERCDRVTESVMATIGGT